MARNKKFNKKQLKDLRSQVRATREKILLESEDSSVELEEKINNLKNKKDKLGFTNDDRANINKKINSLEKKGPKVTWNFDVGSLVYIPGGEVGIIVKNEAQDVEIKNYDYDMKNIMKSSGRYAGQVYVVTSGGNNWYYPRQLKVVRE